MGVVVLERLGLKQKQPCLKARAGILIQENTAEAVDSTMSATSVVANTQGQHAPPYSKMVSPLLYEKDYVQHILNSPPVLPVKVANFAQYLDAMMICLNIIY